jgi:hypothetical protein
MNPIQIPITFFDIFNSYSSSSHAEMIHFCCSLHLLLVSVQEELRNMTLSRRDFLSLAGQLVGGWLLVWSQQSSLQDRAQMLADMGELAERLEHLGFEDLEAYDRDRAPASSGRANARLIEPELMEIGHFNEISPRAYSFDENKYAPSRRKLAPGEWDRTNRHMPIKIDQEVINKPGERSPEALQRVVEYTRFNTPRYVAAPGERVSMCNIAAWDWSRALQLHLPHWIGETEMSANMLFRWVSHPQAGGVYGEGWQPVGIQAAKLLANHGIPVFALAENPQPGRHGHVAMVYPNKNLTGSANTDSVYFASVANGRSRGGNGIKKLESTFRWLKPTFFVHKADFILFRD